MFYLEYPPCQNLESQFLLGSLAGWDPILLESFCPSEGASSVHLARLLPSLMPGNDQLQNQVMPPKKQISIFSHEKAVASFTLSSISYYFQHLAQCLTLSEYSVNICQTN